MREQKGWGLLVTISGWIIGYTLVLGGVGLWLENRVHLKSGVISIPLGFLGLALSFFQIYRYIRRP